MDEVHDIAVIGAGAAGLFAATWAGRTLRAVGATGGVVALDGAARIGAKVLVAGGGRCNVTHFEVDESAYAGTSRNAIKKVLRQFGVEKTVEFFRERGVELKREETGKLFPVTDDARTVLDALLGAAADAGVALVQPWRVAGVRKEGDAFVIEREGGAGGVDLAQRPLHGATQLRARRVILATGGKSLPKTGSDGAGYEFARALGHSITPDVFPALVPLLLDKQYWTCALSGIAVEATLEVRSRAGKRIERFSGPVLLTHFGLSGPTVLDISRNYTAAKREDAGVLLVANWLPETNVEQLIGELEERPTSQVGRVLSHRGLPERMVRAMCGAAGVDAGGVARLLTREQRRALANIACNCVLPVQGDRGWLFAEVTAGGVPLSEVRLETMESRVCPGLHLCGEILDVDGRIGGFNFQWAWASGFVAGCGAARG